MDAFSLKRMFDARFDVEVVISNRHMYQVSGVKRDVLADAHGGFVHSHGGVAHSHSHGEIPHDHEPDRNATPLMELLVMMKYLVSHNDAHAQEVADLAAQLLDAGKHQAYDEIMDAVADFDMVNAKLGTVLSRLSDKKY